MIALILFVAFVNADEYGTLLKAGQRRFSSDGLKQGDNGVKYDIQLVDRYHSLDHDGEVESIMCGENSVLITANQELKDWREGDVFTGDSRWECDSGVSRIVKEITLRKQEEGKYQYFIKTKEAELTDIFKSLVIDFVNPDENDEEGNLKGAVSSYTTTFTKEKTVTVIDRSTFTSKIGGTVTIPITVSDMYVTVDPNDSTSALTYRMKLKASLQYSLKWENIFSAAYSKTAEKELYDFSAIKIDIVAGPVVVTVKITPETAVGISVNLSGSATAVLTYTKKYTATLTLDSEASKKVTYSWADNTASATPKFTCTADISGSASPYIKAGIKVGVGLYGVTIASGTPSLKLQYSASLTTTKLTVQPQLYLGFSFEILWFDNELDDKLIASGTAKSITY